MEYRHVYQIPGQRCAHVAEIQAFFQRIADSPLAFCPVHAEGRDINSDLGAPVRNTLYQDIFNGFYVESLDLFLYGFDVLIPCSNYDFIINDIISGFLSFNHKKSLFLSQIGNEVAGRVGMICYLLQV